MDFNGKRVYIIGGSSGIGLCAARLLAAEGARVMIFARGLERLEKAATEINAARRGAAGAVAYEVMDVSYREEVEICLSRAVVEVGAPDVLINCAGRAYPRRFEDVSYAQFEETMKVNLHGPWHTISALVPHMKGRGGRIVNVSSMAGLVGVFGYTDYCASKFGVVGLSEALRGELKPYGILVSVVCPPDTDTPGFEVENRTKPMETRAISEGAGLMRPEDVARSMIEGVRRGRFLITPGFQGRLTAWAKRLAPWLVEWLMDRRIRSVRRGPGF